MHLFLLRRNSHLAIPVIRDTHSLLAVYLYLSDNLTNRSEEHPFDKVFSHKVAQINLLRSRNTKWELCPH